MTTNRQRHLKSEFALFQTTSILFSFISIVKFFWGWIRKDRKSRKRKRKFLCFVRKTVQGIRKFHVAVVHWRLRNVQKAWCIWCIRKLRVVCAPWVQGIAVEPRFLATRVLRKPCYYGQFSLSQGKECPYIFSKFNPINTDTSLLRTVSMAPSVQCQI